MMYMNEFCFGYDKVNLSDMPSTTNSGVWYLGNNLGPFSTIATAKPIDLKHAKISYPMLNKLQLAKVGADIGTISKEKYAVTIATNAAKNGKITLTLNGTAFDAVLFASGSTPSEIAAIIAGESFDGWTVSADGAVVTFVADEYGSLGGTYSAVIAPQTVGETVSTTATGVKTAGAGNEDIVFDIMSSDSESGTFRKHVSITTNAIELNRFNGPVQEVSLPSSCGRFVIVKATVSATLSGYILMRIIKA
jgi:hypothetical protein